MKGDTRLTLSLEAAIRHACSADRPGHVLVLQILDVALMLDHDVSERLLRDFASSFRDVVHSALPIQE